MTAYELIEGVDANDLDATELRRQRDNGELTSWAEVTPTEVAIARSHHRAWRTFLDRDDDGGGGGAPYALILEDDVELRAGFVDALNALHAAATQKRSDGDGYDVLLLHNQDVLGRRARRTPLAPSPPLPRGLALAIEPTPYVAGTCAYVMSRRFARAALARRYPVTLPIDFFVGEVAAATRGRHLTVT